MPAATAYVLHVPEGRRDIILSYAEENRHDATRYVAEPCRAFPTVATRWSCWRAFATGAITHIADGRKGMSAGTGLARLNMTELQRLERPLPFEELVGLVPARFRAPLRRHRRIAAAKDIRGRGGRVDGARSQPGRKAGAVFGEPRPGHPGSEMERKRRILPCKRNPWDLHLRSQGCRGLKCSLGRRRLEDRLRSSKACRAHASAKT